MSSSPNQPGRLRGWQRALVLAGVVAGLVFLGAAFLFSGSRVRCQEIAGLDQSLTLRCSFDVTAEPKAVWDAFTRTNEPLAYYFDAILEAEMRPGGRWRFLTDDRERFLAGGEILHIEPPRRFVQTFRAADLSDPPSRITVDLEPTATGSRVTLSHDRFASRTETFRRFRRAHPLALSALAALLETGELPVRARLYTLIFKPGMKTFTVRAEPWE